MTSLIKPRVIAFVLLISRILLGATVASTPVEAQGVSVLTFHNDNARLGWNARETRLSPANVSPETFGKLWHQKLDGLVHGSPLYVADLKIKSHRYDVVYAATDHNSVYALNAADGHILWSRRQLAPSLNEPQFSGSWGWAHDSRHGVLSTPVIDAESGTIYVCTIRAKGLRQLFQVWGLDIRTGNVQYGWPVTLRGHYKNTSFAAGQVMQRGALSLVNGWVYVPFGGRGDTPPWRGWVLAVKARGPSLPPLAFCSSPVTDGAGIWSGGGLSAGASGDLFVVTGNGDYDFLRGGDNLGQTVLRLKNRSRALQFTRQPTDFYTPANYKHLDQQDEDLGGATANVLPDLPHATTPHLLFTGGKDGLAYLLNRDRLGGIGGEILKMRLYGNLKDVYHEGIRATSAYFDAGKDGRFLFVAGDQNGPKGEAGIVALQLRVSKGQPQLKPVWTLKKMLNGPSSPIVSSHGVNDGIVWIVETDAGDSSLLHAYEARHGKEIYRSDRPADQFASGMRFTSPIVANGRVFVGAEGVVCFGLRAQASLSAAPSLVSRRKESVR